MKKDNFKINIVLWVIVFTVLLLSIYQGINYNSFINLKGTVSTIISLALTIFVFIHGIKRYGWKNLLIFFLISAIGVLFFENLSISIGFPMNQFNYSDLYNPKIVNTPVLLPILYFQMIYLAWTLAHVILDNYTNKLKGLYIVAIPIIATFICIMWDVVIDPSISNVIGFFTWNKGGGYFGTPLTGFIGEFLYIYLLYQVFAIFISRKAENEVPQILSTKQYWLQGMIMYLSWPIMYFLIGFFVKDRIITTTDHHTWHISDLYQTAGVVAIVTMIFISVLVFLKIIVLDKERI